jgi:hypothetical protein
MAETSQINKTSRKTKNEKPTQTPQMGLFGGKKKNGADAELKAAVAQAAAASAQNRPPTERAWQAPPREFVELGTIHYVNLTPDGKHGRYQTALDVAKETGRPIFANFVEWSG